MWTITYDGISWLWLPFRFCSISLTFSLKHFHNWSVGGLRCRLRIMNRKWKDLQILCDRKLHELFRYQSILDYCRQECVHQFALSLSLSHFKSFSLILTLSQTLSFTLTLKVLLSEKTVSLIIPLLLLSILAFDSVSIVLVWMVKVKWVLWGTRT